MATTLRRIITGVPGLLSGGGTLHNPCDFDAIRIVGRGCNPFRVPGVLLIEYRQTGQGTTMNTLALSTLLFQAFATVTLVLGAAAESLLPARRR